MLVGTRFGPFEIEKELGSGAMGTVYRAQFHRDGKVEPVALKVVSLALIGNEGAIARFEREADILQQLRHPHIVRYRGSGTHKPSRTKFIAMEFVDGEPLDAILTRRVRISWEDVVHWGKQLCSALQHAHEKGIIHRDLKPSNLMITTDNQLKLADFGIAKDTDVTALTGANSTIGTAAYMSPEQCKGARDLTAKSDLYSLGIVFYELLTGRKPFFAESTVDMFLKHVNEMPVRPRKFNAEIPIWLDNLVMFLIEKDKDNRPLDAATVGKMLVDVEEKVKSQASVGAEIANARKIDRPVAEGPLDETDREIARTLRTGKKSKKKKKTEEWYRKPWVGMGAAALLFLGLVTGVYLAVKPEGMDGLYATVKAAPLDSRLEPAAEFLNRFGDRDDPRVQEIRTEFQAARRLKTEKVLATRFDSKLRGNSEGFEPDAYSAAMLALEAEKAGELTRAADQWEIAKLKQPEIEASQYTDAEQAMRGSLRWVAEKHLTELRQGVPSRIQELRGIIDDQRGYDREPKTFDAADPVGFADRALRFEDIGDRPGARSAWVQLATLTEKDPEQRVLYLLATQQALRQAPQPGSPEPTPADRENRLAKKLGELAQQADAAKANPNDRLTRRDIRNVCRDIVYLYQSDPSAAIQTQVKRAEQLQASLPK